MPQFSWGFLAGFAACLAIWQREHLIDAARWAHAKWKARKSS